MVSGTQWYSTQGAQVLLDKLPDTAQTKAPWLAEQLNLAFEKGQQMAAAYFTPEEIAVMRTGLDEMSLRYLVLRNKYESTSAQESYEQMLLNCQTARKKLNPIH